MVDDSAFREEEDEAVAVANDRVSLALCPRNCRAAVRRGAAERNARRSIWGGKTTPCGGSDEGYDCVSFLGRGLLFQFSR